MNEQFIFGKDKVPSWFDEQAKQGRVKLSYSEENKLLVGAKIFSGVSTYEAKVGDTIINSKSGLIVIAKANAEKYTTKKNTKEEEK